MAQATNRKRLYSYINDFGESAGILLRTRCRTFNCSCIINADAETSY